MRAGRRSAWVIAAGVAGCLAAGRPSLAQDTGSLMGRVAQARTFANEAGEAIWPGLGAAPFGILLIEADREVLVCQTPAPSGFVPMGLDPTTGCEIFTRPRSGMSDGLLAAMPLFGPPSTIVVGSPESTGLGAAAWTRTLIHEHFHQWQSALPEYFTRVDALDLKGGDESGMWMLNFPFPYEQPAVVSAHRTASLALSDAVAAREGPEFETRLALYLKARSAFRASVGDRNWRYAEFQLWQEGVARWTEIVLGLQYRDPEVRAAAEDLRRRTLAELKSPDLGAQGRIFAYAHGAAEAMLLERCDPTWRTRYPGTLSLAPLLEQCITHRRFNAPRTPTATPEH